MSKRLSSFLRSLVLFLLLWGTTSGPYAQVNNESQLKAAYLVNFMKYVEWPASSATATICLFGRDTLGGYLAAYESRLVGGRELHIRRVTGPDQLADCQLLFVPDNEEARYGAVLRWVDRLSVLTVSDSEVFTRYGGAIALVRAEGRLQFDINLSALGSAGLKPSSQLMRLARQVVGGAR